MAPSNASWVFGRADSYGSGAISILSYWAVSDAGSDEEQETQVIRCRGDQVEAIFVPFHCVDILELDGNQGEILVVGLEGDIEIIGPNQQFQQVLDASDNGPKGRGPIRALSRIHGKIFAVGMQRQVYRYDLSKSDQASERWVHFERGLTWSPLEMSGFNDLAGYSKDELYAVGWHGELQYFDGSKWILIDSPTNVKLERVVAAPDGRVYAAGQRGVLLAGRGHEFKVIFQDVTNDSFWGLCWAFGQLWIASAHTLFNLSGDLLRVVDPGITSGMTYGSLAASEDRLWSLGRHHVISSQDGSNWQQVFF